ncbi:MAG TPA: SAM-dependent methyltransferase, partial [Acidimicrobiia bacterium]|nr:SAM-dependent methyltransferase [Acidimicrobiia bacterium]
MEAALYDPAAGFFATTGRAGRAGGDFLTSVEVGSLFGALIARAIDGWWEGVGRPDPFLVVDAGAGRGQLARDVLRAGPRCAPALRYVLVERSATLRAEAAEHLPLEPAELALGPAVPPEPDEEPVGVPGSGPMVTALADLPAGPATGAVVANELADNLPFRIVERTGAGWSEVRVGEGSGAFSEVVLPADEDLAASADRLAEDSDIPVGARLPVPTSLSDWLRSAAGMLRRGVVAVVDYGAPVEELAVRGQAGWLRTFRGQRRGGSPLEAPGSQDITADVPAEALRRAAAAAGLAVITETTQADWLRSLGVEEL